ncbi:MAG TPA: hypothetical protein VLA72_21695 [Anaerolineales bacterium]|nr:hypothetical protein [Anaerolineales bacterium]
MEKSKISREYPPVYERLIPIALWTIGTVVFVLLLITIAVALRS